MLTGEATQVNAPSAVMKSIGEIAERDHVSKPAVSRKVKQLVAKHSLQTERDAQGRVAKVNVAQYDELRGRTDDPSKAQSKKPPAPAVNTPAKLPDTESYDEALRQKTWVEAERARFAFDKDRGKYVEAAGVADGASDCGKEIARIVNRLQASSDELAVAVGREGVHGLRLELKKISERMLTDIANALGQLATNAPDETSPPIGGEVEAVKTPQVDA
jgi:hypothetical protein